MGPAAFSADIVIAEEPAPTVTELETKRNSESLIISGKSIALRNEPEAIAFTLTLNFHLHAFYMRFHGTLSLANYFVALSINPMTG